MNVVANHDASILIVDDEPANISLLERTLRGAGYTRLLSTTEPERAIDLFAAACPDLVLLDLHMPRIDGFAVLERIARMAPPQVRVPVLVLTADVTLEARRRALASGAHDFVIKPFDLVEVLLRVGNLLETREAHQSLANKAIHHERETGLARIETLDRLAVAAEFRDDETGAHVERVGALTGRLALAMGLSDEQAALFGQAARLHDLGKIGIPDRVLTKPGSLTDDEWTIMRTHTTMGAEILTGSASPILRVAAQIAASHHERWDGAGYPAGLAGEAIPLAARITCVADAFDAITTNRRYRAARPLNVAIQEIRTHSGRQFDASVVRVLAECTVEASARAS